MNRVLRDSFVVRMEHHPVIGSTNDRARECALESDCATPLLVLADRQTAGRGRGAHRWWSDEGSLTFSLVLEPARFGIRGEHAALVSLAAAVAVVETLQPLAAPHQVGIWWPNDVCADERKIAGILIEVLPNRRHVIGIGLNTNNRLDAAPPEVRERAITLRELTGMSHDQTAMLVAVLGALEARLRQLGSVPEQLAARADALCLQHGKLLTVRTGNHTITGHCAGIAPNGALLLQTPAGREAISSGVLVREA